MNFIGIPRISSKKQADKGDSTSAQESRFKQWCQSNNHNLIDIYTDPDKAYESATINEDKRDIKFVDKKFIVSFDLKSREPLMKAIQEAKDKTNKWDGILIFKWDRISRNPPFLKLLQTYLESFGKVIIPTDDPIDPLASDIVQIVGKYEIDKMKARVRETRKYRFEQGIMTGRSPFGFQPLIKDKKVIGFKPLPKQAHIVQDVFKFTIEGKDYKEICKHLKIAPQQYYNIIKNPVYCGYIQFEGQIKKGLHEIIIPLEIFKQVNPNFKFPDLSFIKQ